MSDQPGQQARQASKLFSPIELGKLKLRNRIVMAPMTRNASPGHIPNDKVVDYYRRRAEGGVGLIITEGTCVNHKAASGYPDVPFIYGEESLAGWKRVVDAVHEQGALIAPQLWHVGAIRRPGTEPNPEIPGYGPSGMAMPGKVTGHAMTKQDIQEVIAAFAQAAHDAKATGFDAVEIHGAHGYLIDQFFWDGTNQRTDEYGGSLADRSRFAIELIQAVRNAVGPDFPIIFRWSQWKQQDYTARLVDNPVQLEAFLKPLVEAGVDIFHCSTRRFREPEFPGSPLNLAGWTRKLTGKPAITVGSVGLDQEFLGGPNFKGGFNEGGTSGVDELVERINNDEFDLVAVGRALIANPDWPVKIRNGEIDQLRSFTKNDLHDLV